MKKHGATSAKPGYRGMIAGLLLAIMAVPAAGQAEQDEAPDFSREGADTCLGCHGEDDDYPVLSIFRTPHGVMADDDSPFANLQCESCHGPGGDHAARLRPGQERAPIQAFGSHSVWETDRENAVCMDCHQGRDRMHWTGSAHERRDVACADCHTVHATHDPVSMRSEQPRVCFDCHTRERAEVHQASAHPIRWGQMDCASCHEPHGSANPAMLTNPTVNETCYSCHAEMRGPFLWEHAPVAEDCSTCHRPHGSNHPALLERRAPMLCQQCHSRAGHPSVARDGRDLPSGRASSMMLSGSCSNCHSQVHGSNHPSGSNLSR